MFKMCRWKRKVDGKDMFRMCREKQRVSGHIVLEVAILLPLIVLYMVWLVFFMIFLLDMAVVKSEVIRISDEAAVIWDKDGDLPTGKYKLPSKSSFFSGIVSSGKGGKVQGKASSRLKTRIRDRLSLTSCHGQKVRIGSGKVTAQASVRFSWPFSVAIADNLSGPTFTGRGVSPVNDWKDELRSASALKELLE